MKTSELEGKLLNLAVAHCVEQSKPFPIYCDGEPMSKGNYSTDWSKAGPIIEREKIELNLFGNGWMATLTKGPAVSEEVGPTPLVAAMRCYVASVMGEEIQFLKTEGV